MSLWIVIIGFLDSTSKEFNNSLRWDENSLHMNRTYWENYMTCFKKRTRFCGAFQVGSSNSNMDGFIARPSWTGVSWLDWVPHGSGRSASYSRAPQQVGWSRYGFSEEHMHLFHFFFVDRSVDPPTRRWQIRRRFESDWAWMGLDGGDGRNQRRRLVPSHHFIVYDSCSAEERVPRLLVVQ